VKILSLSDVVLNSIYNPQITLRFSDVNLILGCGDLPYYYLDYVASKLDVPLYFVRGNHGNPFEYSEAGKYTGPAGGVDLHRKVVCEQGFLIAGIEGSVRYRSGPYQYSQTEMWLHVLRLVPTFLLNHARYGRFLDIFVSHSPPWGIQDRPDLPHQGIKAFLWLLKVFKPAYHFHGHIHVYKPEDEVETRYGQTLVINAYGYAEIDVETGPIGARPLGFLVRQDCLIEPSHQEDMLK
jgi:Icc-related predicted phosphoesterase